MATILPQVFIDSVVDPVINWGADLGYAGLAVVSATEAALQPVPPDPIIWLMVLDADSNFHIAAIVLVATFSSVAGALVGYGIGRYAGTWFIDRFVSSSTAARLDALTLRYGAAGVFIAAVSPIPYKALAWLAGAGNMNLRLFVIAGLVGRGLRFGLIGFLLGVYGESMEKTLDNPIEGAIIFSITAFFGLLLFIPAAKWWDNLLDEIE